MRIGSLFSGTGALDMGAEMAFGPCEIAWHSDIKPAAARLLDYRFPGVPNLGDIREVNFGTVPKIDVLTAGWPCQPFSAAGLQLGGQDPRALWPEVLRAIDALRPRVFL